MTKAYGSEKAGPGPAYQTALYRVCGSEQGEHTGPKLSPDCLDVH